jgi:hypothetical protein
MIHTAFNHAWNNICDGTCEEHVGECVVVSVPFDNRTYFFSYCSEAIATDRANGFDVQVENLLRMSRVEDTRTPEQRAKDELGFGNDRER